MDSDAFAFRKPSNDVPNLEGVTLHLAFSRQDLLDDLLAGAKNSNVDGILVKTISAKGCFSLSSCRKNAVKNINWY